MRRALILALALCVSVSASLAQDVQVHVRSDSTQILIGDWFPAHLTVQAPADYRIVFPVSDAEFTNAAYIDADSATLESSGAKASYSKEYTLTSFDTGSVAISVNVTYFKPGDTTAYIATSNDIQMDIATVRIDTAETFKDIKDVLYVPYSWWDYILFISGILAVFSLLWFAWYRWKYRPEKEVLVAEAEPEPAIPAEIVALERLRKLEEQKLWEQGLHKEYQSELSEAMRQYIEGKFRFPALEETTPEIMTNIALKGVAPKLIAEVELALQCADLTKFAKYIPDPVAHRQGLKTAYLLVDETKSYIESIEQEVYRAKSASETVGEQVEQSPDSERSEEDVRS